MTFPYGPLGSASSLLLGRGVGRADEEALRAHRRGSRRRERRMDPARDFIVLSEFSEQVGPVPVMVKPEKGAGSFNTSTFSVRIMSSDMQRSLTGGSFAFSDDTQMVLSETVDGLYAYVHYFSLHDINARGYVRQYAISYMTSSMKKITDNFTDFLEKFSEVARVLHCGNHKVFGKDVEHRLADLEHTRDLLSQEGWNADDTEPATLYQGFDFSRENVPERDPSVVESGLTEMKGIMEALQREMHKEDNQRMQLYLESRRRSFQKLVSLYAPSAQTQDAVSFLHTVQDQPLSDSPPLSISSEASLYQPQRVMTHYVHKFDRRLRSLDELSSKAYLVAMERLDFVYKYFSRSESALAIEKEERQFLQPHSSMLTLGRIPVMNVLHDVMMTSRPHLHEPKPYMLCCKGVNPREQLPLAPPILNFNAVDMGRFDKIFIEDPNAIYKYPLYLNPAPTVDPFSDSITTPTPSYPPVFDTTRSGEWQSPPLIRGAEQEEGGGGARENGGYQSSKQLHEMIPAAVIGGGGGEGGGGVWGGGGGGVWGGGGGGGGGLQGLSSGEYQEVGSGASPGFHTPQEYRTPEKGNSPRISIDSDSIIVKEAESHSHTHLSSSRNSLLTSNLTTSHTPSECTNGKPDKPVSDKSDLLDHTSFQHESLISENHTFLPPPSEATEMEQSTNFLVGPSNDEEGTSAGCGQLEGSFKFEQEGTPDTDVLKGEDKGHHESPSLVLSSGRGGQRSFDPLLSPTKSPMRPPLQSLTSSLAPSRELFSPNSFDIVPEKIPRWPPAISLTTTSPIPLLTSLDQVEGEYKYKPGRGLLAFCKHHMITRDLLYCLLHGRPLVIIGEQSQESMIRRIVRVLWFFVPGYSSSHQVIPWYEKPLTPDDISRMKLVGVCQAKSSKVPVLPPHIKRYVSYWDCTPGVTKVCTPQYEGELLKPILSRTKDRKNEMTFLTHIHSVLSDIAMQAFVYYHGHYLNTTRHTRHTSHETAPVRHHKVNCKEESRKTRRQFLQQSLGLKSNDADIIEYFVSVIQEQQLQEHWVDSNSQNDPVRVRLSARPCPESICKPKKPY